LNILLGDRNHRARQQVSSIEHQVERAAELLADAAAELRRLRAQRTAADNLVLTNSARAAVT
jgi:hypothetical protein